MSNVLMAERRLSLLDDLRLGVSVERHVVALLATTIVCGALYGASLGEWHGPRLAAYAAVKMPLVLIVTTTITALFNWVIASLFSLPMRLAQVFTVSLVPIAIAAVIAASVAPALALFAVSLPPPTPAQHTVHNILYLLHVSVLAGSGIAGTYKLRDVLATIADGRRDVATRVLLAWIVAYGIVGGEVAWALRLFVGSVYLPVVFLREDAFRGNVYEFIFTDILPHFWRSLT